MIDWLRKLFGWRSAVETRRENPILVSAVKKSAEVYATIPLHQLISDEDADRLARLFYLEVNAICNAANPQIAGRQKIAIAMLRFALYQVLTIPPEPDDDPSELRACPGISGNIAPHLETLADKNIALRSDLHESGYFSDTADLRTVVQTEFWKSYWLLETINHVRLELGDSVSSGDWFKPFKHASCANQEYLYRLDLEMPDDCNGVSARKMSTAYSLFTDIVISGARDPLAEWRDYHAGTGVAAPGECEVARSGTA